MWIGRFITIPDLTSSSCRKQGEGTPAQHLVNHPPKNTPWHGKAVSVFGRRTCRYTAGWSVRRSLRACRNGPFARGRNTLYRA